MPVLCNAVLTQDWGPELVYAAFAGCAHPLGCVAAGSLLFMCGQRVGLGIILLGCVGEVMNQAQTLALERDWVLTRYS